jgi:hypothetical protein
MSLRRDTSTAPCQQIQRFDKRKRQGHPLLRMACRIHLLISRFGQPIDFGWKNKPYGAVNGSLGSRPLRYFAASRVNL